MTSSLPVSLISRWFIKAGCEAAADTALQALAQAVWENEPDTLTYLVHMPIDDPRLQSLPPVDASSILFFETYRSIEAFLAHVNGLVFLDFVATKGDLFLQVAGKPYTTVSFLERRAGFVRGGSSSGLEATSEPVANRHSAVMFEIIAKDQPMMRDFYARVFGWHYQIGTGGFAYIHFPAGTPPLLGGIGQADPSIPGFDPGHNFYLLVEDVEPVLAAALAAGGQPLMPPASIDGYRFAMFRDPENNPVGLIQPFAG